MDARSRSRSLWGVNSIPKSWWSSSSSESEYEMLDNKYVSAIGSKGVLIPLSASNRICGYTISEYVWKLNPSSRTITLTKLLIKHAKFTQKKTKIGA